jgi:signal transduction histidine kinase/DNA-binding response OmpR family regulator/sugar lactone lactonase YvrE
MMMKRYFIFGLLLIVAGNSFAQSSNIKHLGVEDGLSNNYVRDIEQDGLGCIWIATESGLSRFDGRTFKVYRENSSNLIDNAQNVLLYDDKENTLWIGTKTGISVFDCATQQFKNHTMQDIPETSNVVHLSHAADGGIWIVNHNSGKMGIIYFDRKTGKFSAISNEDYDGLKTPNWCAFDDGNGNLYVGHALDGLSIVNLKNKTVSNYRNNPDNPRSLPGNAVYSIYMDSQKNIWLGTNQGLALFYPQTGEFMSFKHQMGNPNSLVANPIYNIREMNDGTLWVAADIGGVSILDLHGITFMNPDKVQFRNLTVSNDRHGLSSGNSRSLLQDSFGNIWIGAYGSGVDFIGHAKPLFNTLSWRDNHAGNLQNKPVWGVFADKDEQVWLGGENEIAVFKNYQKKATYNISSYLSRTYTQAFSIKQDKSGIVWFGLYDEGLLRFNPSNKQFEQIHLDIKNIDVITLFEDYSGKLLIGTEYGLYSCPNGAVVRENSINNQLYGNASIYGILRDRQGKLWIGTYGGGVFVFNQDNRLSARLESKNGFCSNSVNSLYMDSRGSIWVATRKGIACIEDSNLPEQYECYNEKQGLQDSYVRAIQEDKDGNIWLSTDNGISFWNRQKMQFDNYDYQDGVSRGNFIEGSACSTSDGIIYFGSLGGVCYFDPKDFSGERLVAPVQIIECKKLNEQIESRNEESLILSENGNIRLLHNQNSFRIAFSVPDYSLNQQVEYSYMMDGLDNVWYGTQGENHVTFRNISPGEYTFRVKARLKNRDWDELHVTTMRVTILPPLWLAWYAKLFYILVLCLLIYVWMRFYKRKLNLESSLELEKRNGRNEQELNQERLRFYTNITHELRTPLTLILDPLEDLLGDAGLPTHYNSKVKIIHNSAVRLLNLINQMLEFRKTETQNRRLTIAKGDLSNLVMETGLHYKELNRNDKVKFHTVIETETTMLYFDADVITTILNNLLSNAMKYTQEGEIRLTLRSVCEKDIRYMEIEVSDTGYGIDSESLPHIFERYYQVKGKHQASGTGIGLALVKSLADLHHGTLHVESKERVGTTFKFRILTDHTYPDAQHKKTAKMPVREAVNEEKEDNSRSMILVVEDNDDIREYIVSSFSSNFRVITATNGQEGLALAQKHIPNIIISDIMMPIMDGMEFCRAVKEDIRTSHIPVILLTAKDSIQDKEEGYESGADSYLTKPFSAKLLGSRVQNLLESRNKLARQIAGRAKKIKPDKSEASLKLSKLDEEFILMLTNLVEENLDSEKLDIAFLAKGTNMSYSTFYRKVKGLTGISVNEFIRKVRLKNSLQLLLSGKYNVSETAYKTGFNDLGYFRECFKEEYGMTPSEYIKTGKE